MEDTTIFFDYNISREIQHVIRGTKTINPRKSIPSACEDRPKAVFLKEKVHGKREKI